MTDTNRYGPGVSWRDVRRWALAGFGVWLPDYLRDSERHHIEHGDDLNVGYARLPKTFRAAPDVSKWAEEALPAIIVAAPGLTDDRVPRKQADRTYMVDWSVSFHAICHGTSEADTELLASVYGLAMRKMVDQQAGAWADDPTYQGPPLVVDSVRWEDEGYDEIERRRARSLVAATTTFTVVFRNASTSMGGPLNPSVDPTVDPGDWPEVLRTELELDREAL